MLSPLPANAPADRPRAGHRPARRRRCARSSTRSNTKDGDRSPARWSRLMRERGADLLAGAACAIPVPLHPSRKRAPQVQPGRRPGASDAHPRRRRAPSACGPLPTQTGLPAGPASLATCATRFAVTPAAATLAGTIVLLIDDVSTTGATLDACARVLKRPGSRKCALTAARVVGRLTADDEVGTAGLGSWGLAKRSRRAGLPDRHPHDV